MGHSAHGKAFDEGPRERPARMDGIGTAHFPISTKHPEVQAWFDQGYTLLLSFWFYEAERTFRWCLQLEPDNAMAYWGLARASEDGDRRRAFLKEALARKDKVTPRERAWLEAYDTDRDSGGRRRSTDAALQARARAPRARVSRRCRGEGDAGGSADGTGPHGRGAAAQVGAGRRPRSSRRPSLSHSQLGRPRRRPGARQLPPLRRDCAAHRSRAAHARPRLRRTRHVPRSRQSRSIRRPAPRFATWASAWCSRTTRGTTPTIATI